MYKLTRLLYYMINNYRMLQYLVLIFVAMDTAIIMGQHFQPGNGGYYIDILIHLNIMKETEMSTQIQLWSFLESENGVMLLILMDKSVTHYQNFHLNLHLLLECFLMNLLLSVEGNSRHIWLPRKK